MARRRADLLSVVSALAGIGLLLCCRSTAPAVVDELPIVDLETLAELDVEAGPGLAESVGLTLRIRPKEPWELTVVGLRPEGERGNDAVMEVRLRWTDFVGTAPVSYGKSLRMTLPFGEDGVASTDAPLERSVTIPLPPAAGHVLARRVAAWVRLHPVDLRMETGRSGGAALDFEETTVETFRRTAASTLQEAVAEGSDASAADVFLAAVEDSAADPEVALAAIMDVLPTSVGSAQEALFGALLYLTGKTQGRSVSRWRAWWAERETPTTGGP